MRLVQGDYERQTVFAADPLEPARRWVEQGVQELHVVDLDGARAGAPVNIEHVARICESVESPVQVGGGLRRAEDVASVLDLGAERAVLGTAALADPALIEALVEEHGSRIVIAADARGDRVATEGWKRQSTITSAELVARLAGRGVRRFTYTPVDVDGTLEGPELEGLRAVAGAADAAGAELVYAGGIGTLDHLRGLAALGLPALTGVIVGRALYEGRFSVAEALATLGGHRPPAGR